MSQAYRKSVQYEDVSAQFILSVLIWTIAVEGRAEETDPEHADGTPKAGRDS